MTRGQRKRIEDEEKKKKLEDDEEAKRKKLEEKKDEEDKEKKGKKDKKKKKKEKKDDEKIDEDKKDDEKIEKEHKEGEVPEKKQKMEEEKVEVEVKEGGAFKVVTIGIKRRKPKKYRCNVCKDLFNSIGDRNAHLREKHDLKEFKCPEENCRKIFTTENSLKRHSHEHGKDGKEPKLLKCPSCPMTFVHESQLKRHSTSHSDDTKYRCLFRICKDRKGFKNLSDYNRHMDTHKGDIIECRVAGCNYKGKNRHQMTDHHRSQHSEPKPCKNKDKGCNFSTRDNRAMKRHLPACDYGEK